jgi:hypothetical protein
MEGGTPALHDRKKPQETKSVPESASGLEHQKSRRIHQSTPRIPTISKAREFSFLTDYFSVIPD